jgi:hypothetical protein
VQDAQRNLEMRRLVQKVYFLSLVEEGDKALRWLLDRRGSCNEPVPRLIFHPYTPMQVSCGRTRRMAKSHNRPVRLTSVSWGSQTGRKSFGPRSEVRIRWIF